MTTGTRRRARHVTSVVLGAVLLAVAVVGSVAFNAASGGAVAGASRSHLSAPVTAPPSLPPAPSPPLPIRHVVALGDSVPAGAQCGCQPFADLVARDVAAHRGGSVTTTNLSAGGAASSDLLRQLRTRSTVDALRSADVVLITTGANDLEGSAGASGCATLAPRCFATQLQELPRTLRQIVTTVKASAPPNAIVVMTGYWNVFLDGAVARRNGSRYVRNSDLLTRAVNSSIAAAARADGALYLDVRVLFRGDHDEDDTSLLAPDGDHPNAAGQQTIARGVLALLRAAGCAC